MVGKVWVILGWIGCLWGGTMLLGCTFSDPDLSFCFRDAETRQPLPDYWACTIYPNKTEHPKAAYYLSHLTQDSYTLPKDAFENKQILIGATGYEPILLNDYYSPKNAPSENPVVAFLKPTKVLETKITDAAGNPVEAAQVSLCFEEENAPASSAPFHLKTDTNGRVQIPDLRPYLKRIVAWKEGIGIAYATPDATSPLILHKNRLCVSFTDKGTPMKGVPVAAHAVVAEADRTRHSPADNYWWDVVHTDEKGMACFDFLPSGTIMIHTMRYWAEKEWRFLAMNKPYAGELPEKINELYTAAPAKQFFSKEFNLVEGMPAEYRFDIPAATTTLDLHCAYTEDMKGFTDKAVYVYSAKNAAGDIALNCRGEGDARHITFAPVFSGKGILAVTRYIGELSSPMKIYEAEISLDIPNPAPERFRSNITFTARKEKTTPN